MKIARERLLRSISHCVTRCGKERARSDERALRSAFAPGVSPLNAYSKVAPFVVNWINLDETRNRMPLTYLVAVAVVTVAKPSPERTKILKSLPGLHKVSHQKCIVSVLINALSHCFLLPWRARFAKSLVFYRRIIFFL